MVLTRRSVLKSSVGTVATAGVAGCLTGSERSRDEGLEGYASFFPIWDWAKHVGGEHVSFVNPVDTGQMGHGWSPKGDITRNIASSSIFVYLDSPEFAWAQDIATELKRDYDDVKVIDLLEAIESRLRDHDSTDNGSSNGTHQREAFRDPHVWLDPILAREMIEPIADGLAEIDPGHESDYRQNAGNYVERIESVHEEFETLVVEAERDVAVLAGHDSFGYLEARYGFELQTPVGVSPDAAQSFEDISGVIESIEKYDIETVLYDPFEAANPPNEYPQMVEVIFENTEVDDAKPLSSVSGTTAEWDDRGWGWVEQMTALNRPSLRAALGAGEPG